MKVEMLVDSSVGMLGVKKVGLRELWMVATWDLPMVERLAEWTAGPMALSTVATWEVRLAG